MASFLRRRRSPRLGSTRCRMRRATVIGTWLPSATRTPGNLLDLCGPLDPRRARRRRPAHRPPDHGRARSRRASPVGGARRREYPRNRPASASARPLDSPPAGRPSRRSRSGGDSEARLAAGAVGSAAAMRCGGSAGKKAADGLSAADGGSRAEGGPQRTVPGGKRTMTVEPHVEASRSRRLAPGRGRRAPTGGSGPGPAPEDRRPGRSRGVSMPPTRRAPTMTSAKGRPLASRKWKTTRSLRAKRCRNPFRGGRIDAEAITGEVDQGRKGPVDGEVDPVVVAGSEVDGGCGASGEGGGGFPVASEEGFESSR